MHCAHALKPCTYVTTNQMCSCGKARPHAVDFAPKALAKPCSRSHTDPHTINSPHSVCTHHTRSDRMAALRSNIGAHYVACPVFGRPEAAAARKLISVPGGDASAVERVVPILECTSQDIVRAGAKPSSANLLKLCGNFTILTSIEMFAEASPLAESASVPREDAYELLAGPKGVLNVLPVAVCRFSTIL